MLQIGGREYLVCEEGVVTERYLRWAERAYRDLTVPTEPQEEHVQACMQWLREYARPRKTVNRQRSSYGLKHIVERRSPGGYVSNGAFIEAVCRLGWEVIPDRPDGPNACFRLSYDKRGMGAGA